MGIIKDWRDDTEGYCFKYKIINLLSLRVWLDLHRWRKQRANRGWSDRDTWGAGDHIAKITAEMLQHLNDHTYVDWPDWFKLNVEEAGSYKNLQSVIDDINGYLEYQETSWTDGLEPVQKPLDEVFVEEGDRRVYKSPGWINKETGRQITEKQLTMLMHKHHNKEVKLYKKATNALSFFARQFTSFWD